LVHWSLVISYDAKNPAPTHLKQAWERFQQGSKAIALVLPNNLEKNGEGGIRTLVEVSPKQTFQVCALNHSATSPGVMNFHSKPKL
jgi:hypothetical protein